MSEANMARALQGPEPGGSAVIMPLRFKMAVSAVFGGQHDAMTVRELRERLERDYPRTEAEA